MSESKGRLNVHRFSSHRDKTLRWFLIFDMPMPLTCRLLGHRDETVDLPSIRSSYVQCGRCFRRPPNYERRPESHLEVSRNARWALSLQASIGTAGSETPFDAHVIVPGLGGVFAGTDAVGRRWAHRRTRRAQTERQYETAVTSIDIDKEAVRWRLGVPRDSWRASDNIPKWRDGSWQWRDALLGKRTHELTVLGRVESVIVMPEGKYPATLTLERRTWDRERWPHPDTHVTVDITLKRGIPNGREKWGDWDATYGFGVKARGDDWAAAAAADGAERMLADRERYATRDWLPPTELAS